MELKPPLQEEKQSSSILLILTLVVVFTVGIIAVTWFLIETLQQNSLAMRTYKVRPQPYLEKSVLMEASENVLKGQLAAKYPEEAKLMDNAKRMEQDNPSEALQTMIKAADLLKRKMPDARHRTDMDESKLSSCQIWIAVRLKKAGRLDEALDYATRAINDRPAAKDNYGVRAGIYRAMGRPEDAGKDSEMYAKLFNQSMGEKERNDYNDYFLQKFDRRVNTRN